MKFKRSDSDWQKCNDFREKKCPVCEKKFFSTNEWAYVLRKNGKKLFYCSWKCYRAAYAMGKRVVLSELQRNEVEAMVAEGASNDEIARKYGISNISVNYYRRKAKTKNAKGKE